MLSGFGLTTFSWLSILFSQNGFEKPITFTFEWNKELKGAHTAEDLPQSRLLPYGDHEESRASDVLDCLNIYLPSHDLKRGSGSVCLSWFNWAKTQPLWIKTATLPNKPKSISLHLYWEVCSLNCCLFIWQILSTDNPDLNLIKVSDVDFFSCSAHLPYWLISILALWHAPNSTQVIDKRNW